MSYSEKKEDLVVMGTSLHQHPCLKVRKVTAETTHALLCGGFDGMFLPQGKSYHKGYSSTCLTPPPPIHC